MATLRRAIGELIQVGRMRRAPAPPFRHNCELGRIAYWTEHGKASSGSRTSQLVIRAAARRFSRGRENALTHCERG